MSRSLPVLALGVILALLTPFVAYAFPFGGAIGTIKPCYNNAIYVNLGPPRGGPYIWTPSTRTYQFGPPRRTGQWLLGLASAPYYCVVSIFPVIVWPGTHIDMMGSSGAAAPRYVPPATPTQPTPSPTPSTGSTMTSQEYCEFLKKNPSAPRPTVDPCLQ